MTRRRAGVALLVAGASLAAGGAAYRARLDPWPARAALRLRDDKWPLDFTPDGRSFATSSGNRITIRDWATGTVRSSWPVPSQGVASIGRFSPDGRTFAALTWGDHGTVQVALIDVATGRVRATGATPHTGVTSFAYAPDGASVLLCVGTGSGRREVVAFDAATGAVRYTCPPSPPAGTGRSSIPRDGRFWVYFDAKDGPISIEDVGPPKDRTTPTPIGLSAAGASGSVDCSQDGRTLAVGRLDGTIDLWDLPGRRPIRTIPHPKGDARSILGPNPAGSFSVRGGSPAGWALGIAFGPDGRTLATTYGNADESLPSRLLNRANWALGRTVTPPPLELFLLDCGTGRRLAGLTPGGQLHYSRDGRTVATFNHEGQALELRDIPAN